VRSQRPVPALGCRERSLPVEPRADAQNPRRNDVDRPEEIASGAHRDVLLRIRVGDVVDVDEGRQAAARDREPAIDAQIDQVDIRRAARVQRLRVDRRVGVVQPRRHEGPREVGARLEAVHRAQPDPERDVERSVQLERVVGRLVLPFVRTPTNIFKYAGERTPLAFASHAVRDEISAGGARRALALAKISLGAMTMSYIGLLAAEGLVTGGGPKDKQLRQGMMMTGWQPYSFKIGDTYYKYSRLEPIGSLFGLAADAADLLGQLPEKDAAQLATAFVVALSRNVSQKTFVKGLAGTLNAVSSQDINVVKAFLEQELPTILPYSTGLGQTARAVDPVMREVSSLLDALKAKVPGLSETLPPRRNLWGEAIALEGGLGPDLISPIYTSTMKLDSVSHELVRLDMPVSMPAHTVNGVPLNEWEYDAYVVLQGSKPIVGDMTLKARLADLLQSDLYRRSSDGKDGGKKVLIQQWINSYREMARYILGDEELSRKYVGTDFPDLRNQIQGAREKARQQFNAPTIVP